MADGSKIEWTEATWQIVTGCSIVSPGCQSCYAMRLAGGRLRNHPSRRGLTDASKTGPVWNGKVRFNDFWLDQPLKWTRPRTIFVAAHGDLFHEGVSDEWLDQIFAVMALSPQHAFQVLTKRAARMKAYVDGVVADRDLGINRFGVAAVWSFLAPPSRELPCWPLPNVWLGVSAERQQEAEERVPLLMGTPAAIRFVSAEPLIGPIDFAHFRVSEPDENTVYRTINALTGVRGHGGKFGYTETADPVQPRIDWIIVGGESGPRHRGMDLAWARSLRDQCAAADVAFFFKQTAGKGPIPNDLQVRQFPVVRALEKSRREGIQVSPMTTA